MKRHESSEDYLERILMLKESHKTVRAIDIANDMGFSKASVSIALKKLKDQGLVSVDETSGNITLTLKGNDIASHVYERHKILVKMLIALGVKEETALKDACRIEHDISEETFQKIKAKFG